MVQNFRLNLEEVLLLCATNNGGWLELSLGQECTQFLYLLNCTYHHSEISNLKQCYPDDYVINKKL